MLNRIVAAQVSDTTDNDSSNAADKKNKSLQINHPSIFTTTTLR